METNAGMEIMGKGEVEKNAKGYDMWQSCKDDHGIYDPDFYWQCVSAVL